MIPIAQEVKLAVWAVLLIAVLAAIYAIYWLALLLSVLFALLVTLFRDFPRPIPSHPLACVSPVDGRIVEVKPEHDPFLEREALRVRLRQSITGEFNTHFPIEGKIVKRWSQGSNEGRNSYRNCVGFWIQTDEEDDIVVAYDLTSFPHYSSYAVQPGERVGQGQRCGFIGFGNTVDVFMPATSRSEAVPNQHVLAGSDIIGTLTRV